MNRRKALFGLMFIGAGGFFLASKINSAFFGDTAKSLNNCVSAGYTGGSNEVAANLPEVGQDLDKAIVDDYINNQTILVNGWIFSTTELDFIKSQLAQEGKFHNITCSIKTQIVETTSNIINWAIIFRRYISTIKNQGWPDNL